MSLNKPIKHIASKLLKTLLNKLCYWIKVTLILVESESKLTDKYY